MKKCSSVRRCLPHGYSVLLVLATVILLAHPRLVAQGARVQSATGIPSDSDKDNVRLREQWFRRGRLAPYGQSSAELRYRAHRQKLNMRALRAQQASARLNSATPLAPAIGWVALGPAPLASDSTGQGFQDYGLVAGRATAVVVDPADSTGNTVYVGGAYGGVWRSQNAAAGSYGNASAVTWTALTDAQPTLAVGSIALQPGNVDNATHLSRTILVGTGEANDSADSYYGLGILRSTNEGQTWSLITSADSGSHPFLGMAAGKIAFSTVNNNLVVAGFGASAPGEFEGGDTGFPTTHGIYYSLDAGATWHLADVRDPGGAATVPSSARAVVFNAANQTFYASIRRHGIYSSTNGSNWTRLAKQPDAANLGLNNATSCPASANSISCPLVRGEFAVVPGRNEMYVWYMEVIGGFEIDKGIWKSVDGGANWTAINTSGIDCQTEAGCGVSQGAYNLTLAAVPSGPSGTDLYAGAVNLFKCSVNSNNPICSSNPFINLTHVYGCSPLAAPSHVHPDQHGIDYMVANSKSVMYFANDGGIYRALDGFTGLQSGSCLGTNQFDGLNQNIGSLTQFVAFSQHPSDPSTLLGGTQDNGSPATAAATTSTSWINVNNGDGGFNVINPTSPNDWFTSHPDVGGGTLGIEHCSLGIGCHAQDFANGVVITSANLQGDDGAFYFPFLLDPQASTQMLVGTCRIWRGPALGTGSFTALSNNFDTNTPTVCIGSEVNQVTAIAAGGPKDTQGFSKVVYATTFGGGTYISGGGKVFATTNAGSTLMSNVTGNINPAEYAISGVAVDASDPTGQTAYVTVMGFHVPHVFKTSNAGQTWGNFSGTGATAIPDSPANAVVLAAGADPNNGVVFVATDTGVFSSPTNAPNWTEVGPAPGPGVTGFLPNTTVTALGLFRAGGQTLLRAATHGRGVWQIVVSLVPDFQTVITNTPLTIYAGQAAAFSGTISAAFGYNSSVALSCTTGSTQPPTGCTPSPLYMTPTANGVSVSVSSSSLSLVNDYSFNLHEVGSDTNTTTHDVPLVLHVVDFNLTSPSPSSVSVPRGTSSGPISFQVTAAGSFSGTVNLGCSGLPTGASCNFSPSSAATPTSGSPVAITLTVDVAASTATGTYSINLSGSVAGAPAPKIQNVNLVVQLNPDFILSEPSAFPNVKSGHSGTGAIRVASQDGFSATVNLSCSFPTTTCNVSPSSINSFPANPSVTVDGTGLVGTYQMTVTGTSGSKTHVLNVPFTVGSFTVPIAAAPNPVVPGQIATATLDVHPAYNYTGIVVLSCDVTALIGATCDLNPAGPLTINSANPVPFSALINVPTSAVPGTYNVVITGADQTGVPAVSRVLPVTVVQDFQFGAFTSSQSVRPGQTASYSLNVSPLGGNFQHSVAFSCAGLPALASCSFSPANLPAGSAATNVTLAISTRGPNSSASLRTGFFPLLAMAIGIFGMLINLARHPRHTRRAALGLVLLAVLPITFWIACGGGAGGGGNINPPPLPVVVSISPTAASVFTSSTQQFTAAVNNSSNTQVSWDVNSVIGGNASVGTINSAGLYTAPVSVPNQGSVTVRATAQADASKSDSAAVTIQPTTPAGVYHVSVTATEGAGGAALTRTLSLDLIIQ
jgi:hypothetical protein